ncbi:MAG TPA: adenylate/guanylate cyclase domain-containing protein [Aldersonia sp.]
MEDTEDPTADHIYDVVEAEVESYLLGSSRRHTTTELVERASVTLVEATDLWVALGFPIPRQRDTARYTDVDADAMHTLAGLVEDGIIDARMRLALARTIGQATARLAEWQSDVLTAEILNGLEDLGEDPSDRKIRKLARRTAERTIPALEQLQNYVWRRHMAAAMRRSLAATRTDPAERNLVVGFADMVGYTRLTRHLDRDELTDLLEAFESITTHIVTSHGGAVIKNVGDEVMFVVDEPAAAADLALDLRANTDANDDTPQLRIGLAAGPVLQRFGDVYGSTVNIAARLTGVARPSTVLIDDHLADVLADDPRYAFRHLRDVRVHGINRLGAHVLRRAEAGTPGLQRQ